MRVCRNLACSAKRISGELQMLLTMPGWCIPLLPQLRRIQAVGEEFVGIDSLEARLRNAVLTSRSQVAGPPQICAWVRTSRLMKVMGPMPQHSDGYVFKDIAVMRTQ